ncbi:MAG: bifunctional diguanylate cyclase/phosphodiesterase [Phaeovulum sp.]|uniref:bifunctional diguanylate cyclase/phosphodiesterase n=1 Tax=Phaeovulum sp. TaxID=2934796 RepID=UPI0027324AAC|nr:bifunctional diguanylate cyclase/phosphodiesterase [Phaeovulum sp.]MDP3860653.1 bifunctional diguanylate cyclase/phosphodiesterase [Phaeovulum sp.]
MSFKHIRGLAWLGEMTRRDMLAFVPAAGLAGYWFGLAGALLVVSAAVAVAWLARMPNTAPAAAQPERDPATRLPLRAEAEAVLEAALEDAAASGRGTAAFVIGLDDAEALATASGEAGFAEVMRRTAERLHGALREHDLVAQLGGGRFAVVLAPVRRADLESVLQIAARLQSAVEVPLSRDQGTVYVSAHVGFCLVSRAPARNGTAMLAAAETAAGEARRFGPGAIRAYSTEIERSVHEHSELTGQVGAALEEGQIIAHFLPQLCSDTGEVSGFELVPVWLHPERGFLTSADFAPAIRAEGLQARLSEVMLYHGFSALRGWAGEGLGAATLTLPVTLDELRNPSLPERLKWDLDRFDTAPARLRVQVPETAASDSAQDIASHTLAKLAQIGCSIELAGFGNGPAPISAIRKCSVRRLRIDRSFVVHVDSDPEQQSLVAAILSLAEQLGVETLADGVASLGEHAMLAQLGCGYVQGPAVARAMAYEDTLEWIGRHRAKLQATPRLGLRKR